MQEEIRKDSQQEEPGLVHKPAAAHAERLKNYERALEEGVEILERVRKTARARDTETSWRDSCGPPTTSNPSSCAPSS